MSSSRPLTVADLAHTLGQMGWQRPAAAGIAGNVAQESGVALTPGAVGDNGNAIGLAQWNGPRAQALQTYARERGKSWNDPQVQVQFLNHEIDTQYPDLRDRLNAISNPAQAAQTFMNTYERPAERAQNGAIRGQFAQQIFSTLQRLSPIQPAEAASPDAPLSLDDALNQIMPQEPSASGGISLDDALNQYFGSSQDIQPVADNMPRPVEAPRTGGSIPIDPNAVNAPESPPMGDQRLQRDLINMATMASSIPAAPIPGAFNALRGLFTLSRMAPEPPAQPQAQTPQPQAPTGVRLDRVAGISKPTPKPQEPKPHWSLTQKRDSMGRFLK